MNAKKRKDHPIRHRLEYGFVMGLYGLFRLLPRSWTSALGSLLGEAAYYLIPRRRRITLDNLRLAFGAPGVDPLPLAHAAYRSLGRSLTELLGSIDQDRAAILRGVRIEGRSHLEEAFRQGRGVIFLASHYGNWELMSLVNSAMGVPTYVLARMLDNPWLNRLINGQRERFGATVINNKDPSSVRQILSALHKNKAVAFLMDQNVVGDRGVYVDFFGRLAYTHKVVALMAIKTGAPVIPSFMDRIDGDGHRLVYEKALPLVKTGNRDYDVWVNTQMMTRAVEEAVRRHPELWLWMHDRWRKQPSVGTEAVFLDRDGTVSREVGYIHNVDHLQLHPNSARAIRRLNRSGMKVFVVTNQSGVARGYYSEEHVRRVNARLVDLLKAEGAELDGIFYCPHHPTEGSGTYTQPCGCRKPEPGLLYQAASARPIDLHRSYVVGDKMTDMEMAHRVGSKGILVLTGYGSEELERSGGSGPQPDRIVPDLEKAVDWVLSQGERGGGNDTRNGTDGV